MLRRHLGSQGPEVSAVGLGCMGMSGVYGPADENESIATIHAAIDAGVNFIDTGDFYGTGHNEMLIGRAIEGRRDQVFLSVKFGPQIDPAGNFVGFDARPNALKTALAYSLRRLKTDHVDLYQPARVDPNVPIEDTVGAIKEMIDAGYVRWLGLSEASAATIRRANAVHPVAALQIEYSLASRDVEAEVMPTLTELGIGMVPYGVLGRGLLGGRIGAKSDMVSGDSRAHHPRFTGDNLTRNLGLVGRLRQIAEARGVTPAQLAIAWVMAQGEYIVPAIGSRTRAQLADMLAATQITLAPDELTALQDAVPSGEIAGERYPAPAMRMLNG